MKRIWILLLVLLLSACSLSESSVDSGFELFMINVGKGDAILAFVNEKTYLIDTGKAEMFGSVQAALIENGVQRIDGLFITHTDKDHIGGVQLLLDAGFSVDRFYASGYTIEYEKEEKHPLVIAAKSQGKEVKWLYAGDEVDGVFEVLQPSVRLEDKENNNSLVMMLKTSAGNALLTGDMEYPEENILFSTGANLKCDVLKVPNHADNDTLSANLIAKAKPKIALISTSSYEKPETPDPALVSRLETAGAEIYYTEFTEMGIRVSAAKDGIHAAYEKWKNAPALPTGLFITRVDAKNDLIYISSDQPIDLSGFQLYSDKGNEMMVFKKGTVIPKGETIIGTKTSDKNAYDILWDDKNVIHNSKTDEIYLLDPYGRTVGMSTNGY
ncbi:MAG: MBL fold metallo-hydrolase [Clostridia bacterium]|nr:MBL fold metallo-hydrolase [Clostridia bacterium]